MDLFTKVKAFQGLTQAWLPRLEGLQRNHPRPSSIYYLKAHCPRILGWPQKGKKGKRDPVGVRTQALGALLLSKEGATRTQAIHHAGSNLQGYRTLSLSILLYSPPLRGEAREKCWV